ncbi:DUF1292 domain-containing protein [Gallicola sp. Sow4_E12]|uniref:DUF1292 domain-containing protein n=1 Tax=Gallicola sp. Sow4_E12 TaxID=3438785 RepID=UPI003F93E227
MNRLELTDENGEVEIFDLLDTFGMDDDDYAVMTSTKDGENYIFKIQYVDNEVNFIGIEDQDELDDACAIYEELKEEKTQ